MSSPSTVADVLRWLERHGSRRNVEGMARFAIRAEYVLGVSMATMGPLARQLRPNHRLALGLWRSGCHDARILAALIDDPSQLTLRQMNAWAGEFDNWAVCDTTCLHLFDRSPLAWSVVGRWSTSRREFVKRASFALMAGLALHDRHAGDPEFLALLPIIEHGAADDRNFVKKGVNWALRSVAQRSPRLYSAALVVARRLAASLGAAPRWVGQDALRDLSRPLVLERLQRRAKGAGRRR